MHHCHTLLQYFTSKSGHISGQNNRAGFAGQHLQVLEPDRDGVLRPEIPRQCKSNGELLRILYFLYVLTLSFWMPPPWSIYICIYVLYFVFPHRKCKTNSQAPYLPAPFKCLHPDLFVCQLVRLDSPSLTGDTPQTLPHKNPPVLCLTGFF